MKQWQVEDGALPLLKGLELSNCEELKMIPERVKCISAIPDTFATWYDQRGDTNQI